MAIMNCINVTIMSQAWCTGQALGFDTDIQWSFRYCNPVVLMHNSENINYIVY